MGVNVKFNMLLKKALGKYPILSRLSVIVTIVLAVKILTFEGIAIAIGLLFFGGMIFYGLWQFADCVVLFIGDMLEVVTEKSTKKQEVAAKRPAAPCSGA